MNPDSLVPASVSSQLWQALVGFLCHLAGHAAGDKVATKLHLLGQNTAFEQKFQTAIGDGLKRFEKEYFVEDEDLVREILKDTHLFENKHVQASLLALIKEPTGLLEKERQRASVPFTNVFPSRANRPRVDRALNFLMHCIAQQVWHMPELKSIYTLYFQSVTVRAATEQVELHKQAISTISDIREDLHALIELAEIIAQRQIGNNPSAQILPHNLPPLDYTELVGRDSERDKIYKLLMPYPESRHHLVTIEGVGGVGKTALALAVAYRYLDQHRFLSDREQFHCLVWVSAKETICQNSFKMSP